MTRRLIVLLAVALAALFALPAAALADTTDIIEPQNDPPTAKNGFQAGACTSDEPVKCSAETPELFFKTAAGHPPIGFTQYIIQHEETTGNVEPAGIPIPTSPIIEPLANRTIKTLRVDIPPGLTVNPNATPKCPLAAFENKVGEFHVPLCAEETIVGREEVTLVTNVAGAVPAPSPPFPAGQTLPKGAVVPPSSGTGTKVPVYNIEPKEGEPALFGFVIAGKEEVFLESEVAWQSDFHNAFVIHLPGPSAPFSTLKSRLVNFGQEAGNQGLVKAGNGTFLTNPTTCFVPAEFPHLYSTWFRAHSYGEENPNFPVGSTPVEAKVEDSAGNLIQQEKCDSVPFEPTISMDAGTTDVDSPSPATVEAQLPFNPEIEGKAGQSQSHVRKAEVTLPKYMGLNASGAQGLLTCTDAQFKKGVRVFDNECPAESKIGTATVDTPQLNAPLSGDVYVGTQNSTDPESGEEFRILIEAKEPKEGIDARLIGNVKANATTGQLTAVLDEQQTLEMTGSPADIPRGLPQVPFTSVKVHFDGARTVLSSPPICSNTSTSHLEPWARAESKPVDSSVTLTSDPTGGACPKTMAERKFTPLYAAKSDNSKGNAYSPLHVTIARRDGEQELKGIDVTLPEGLAGKLKGIPYCSESNLAAAAGRSGAAEKASPSCPASKIGTATTRSGTGPNPLSIGGTAYLAGPYKGAPLSMAVITPATAGPFDLGTVVVRIALFVDPETTAVTAKSDVVPDVFGGVKLDIRSIVVDLDRAGFIHNPTNCDAHAFAGTLKGGGSDPTNPAAFSAYAFSTPYTTTDCNSLAFKPKLKVQLKGNLKRRGHPKIIATLKGREKDANIDRVALTLPPTMLLDNAHFKTICTRVQLAANQCPKAARYGSAEATSPLIDGKLKGPVYLVSSSHKLPDLVPDLRGQVNIQPHGVVSTVKGGMKTVFNTPDAPVSKFTLRMKGGSKGLIISSTNLCKGKKARRAKLKIKGQNGKKITKKKFNIQAKCKKGKKKK